MNYVQRKIEKKMIAILASVAFALVYLPLKDFAFGVDLAICASYSVTIFANARRKRGEAKLLTGEDAIPLVDLLLGHVLALAALVGIVRLGIYAKPVLPDWLTTPMGTTPGGRHLPSALRYLQTAMVFLVGFVETWWLATVKTPEEKEAQSRIIRGKNAYEEYLSNRLRLR
ncbi:MAG: hypothetical protein ACLGXA_06475 [Acidobacteriota bacterium]